MTNDPQPPARRPGRFLLLALGLGGIALAAGWAIGKLRPAQADPPPPAAGPTIAASDQRGELVFGTYCASCHGPEGHGDGASAAALKPPPLDFAARPWRFEPTPEAIRRVTLEGVPGTGMPSFRTALSPGELEAVVAHVYRLATANPVNRAPSEDEKLLAGAGFTGLTGTRPPPLGLTDPGGRTVKLADFSGQLVLLHFWGTGCTHCLKEVPALNRLEQQHSGRLKVLHVCADADDPAAAQKVLDGFSPGTTALVEANGLGLARYDVHALPTTWLIAPDGTAVGRSSGAKDWAAPALTSLIARWLPPAK